MSEESTALTVTLKGGDRSDSPWIVVRADSPAELGEYLDGIAQAGVFGKVAEVSAEFSGIYAAAAGLGAVPVAVEVPQQVTPSQWVPNFTSPAPSAAAPQAPAAPGGVSYESDKWGNSYELHRPDAPQTAFGPAVLKHGKSQAGKPYKRWVDPRSKSIPSVYASGVRNDPPDLWPGDWAN